LNQSAVQTYETKTWIAAPRAAIWRVMSDVVKWPEWLPTVTAVEPLGESSVKLDARFRVVQPRLRPATWVVTSVRADQSFTWESRSPGLLITAEHSIDDSDGARATVSLRVSFAGLLAPLLGRLFRSTTESYLAQEAAVLRRKIEAERGSAA